MPWRRRPRSAPPRLRPRRAASPPRPLRRRLRRWRVRRRGRGRPVADNVSRRRRCRPRRADRGGAGLVLRRRASARVAQHDCLVIFDAVDVSAAPGDAGVAGPSPTACPSGADVGRGGVGAGPTTAAPASFRAAAPPPAARRTKISSFSSSSLSRACSATWARSDRRGFPNLFWTHRRAFRCLVTKNQNPAQVEKHIWMRGRSDAHESGG